MLHQLIHLTDPHLVTPGRKLYGLDPLDRLDAAVHAIKAHHLDADAIFITGDLTHWGEPAAYAALKRVLEPLPVPYYLVIGNHDHRAAFHAAFPEVPTDDAGFVQYVVPLPEAKGIVLDSLVDGASHGALCEERLGWLERTLAELKDEDVFLFVHHAPFRVGVPSMDRSRLSKGAARLAELAVAHGRVRHLFHGHLHRPTSGSWHGIPSAPARSRHPLSPRPQSRVPPGPDPCG